MIPSRCNFLFAAFAALALMGCAATGREATAAQAPAAASLSVILHAPKPALYTAGQPARSDWPVIAARGVRTVINLRPDAEMKDRNEAAEVRAAGMDYRVLPVAGPEDISADKARELSALLRQADGPVLLHCSSANRAGGLLAVVAAQEGAPAYDAVKLGRAAGMKGAEPRTREVLGLSPSE